MGVFLDSFLWVFWTVTFLANLLLNVNILLTMDENLLEKSPRDRKFRWYKYDQEGLKRGETGFCEVGCGLGLHTPCAPQPSTLGGPAAPAPPENGRIGGGLSATLILGGEEAPLLPS